MKTMMKMLVAVSVMSLSLAAHATTTTVQTNAVLPSQNGHYNDNLCYLKQQDAPVAYTSKASLYGYDRRELKRLEQTWTCKNGQLLGQVENQWVKRNPRS